MTDPTDLTLFEDSRRGKRTRDKQEAHSLDAAKLMDYDLKATLVSLAHYLFGKGKFVLIKISRNNGILYFWLIFVVAAASE